MLVVLWTRRAYAGFGWWTAGLALEVLGTIFFMNAPRIEFGYRLTQDQLQASLSKSEGHRAQMLAFNEMNDKLTACSYWPGACGNLNCIYFCLR